MALAHALFYIKHHKLAQLTNYGEFLDKHPPEREVDGPTGDDVPPRCDAAEPLGHLPRRPGLPQGVIGELDALGWDYELLLCENGSKDTTAAIVTSDPVPAVVGTA